MILVILVEWVAGAGVIGRDKPDCMARIRSMTGVDTRDKTRGTKQEPSLHQFSMIKFFIHYIEQNSNIMNAPKNDARSF
ncbi:MAG: hypothetical protein ACI83P_000946 [Janthinobacterium sp.]|jgi:hypothetical protein